MIQGKDTYFSNISGSDNPNPLIYTGTVIDCSTETFTVDVSINGGNMLTGVPILGMYGAPYNKDLVWLNNFRGATVALIRIYHQFYVLGTLPVQLSDDSPLSSTTQVHEQAHGGDENANGEKVGYGIGGYKNYRCNRPSDIYPGDKVIQVDNSVSIGAFREGVIKLKASPLAQFILCRLNDCARLVSRTFQFFSDFGEVEIHHNSKGRVSARISGGADFVKETHPVKAKWTVQAWIGDCTNIGKSFLMNDYLDKDEARRDPKRMDYNKTYTSDKGLTDIKDHRLNIRVNDELNDNFVQLVIDDKGNMVIKTSNDAVMTNRGNTRVQTHKDSDHLVGGDRRATILGNDTTEVKFDSKLMTVGDKKNLTVGNYSETVNGTVNESHIGKKSQTGTDELSMRYKRTITIQSEDEINITGTKVNIN